MKPHVTLVSSAIKRSRRVLPVGVLLFAILLSCKVLALDPSKQITQYNCQTWTRQNGLPANGVTAITQTKDGYLWLGTSAGLVRFDGMSFELFDPSQAPQIRTSFVKALSVSQQGGLWLGLNLNAFAYCDGKNISFRGKDEWGGVSLNTMSVLETRNGDLWIASQEKACRLASSGVFEMILPQPGTNDSFEVLGLCEDSRGRVWLGTSNKGLFCWNQGTFTKVPNPEFDKMNIYSLVEDKLGRLWIGSQTGLWVCDSDFQKPLIQISEKETRALFVDRQGVLWAGLSNDGLLRYWDGTVTHLRKNDGLAGNNVTAITEDREGSLWIGTQNGLSQLTDIKLPMFGEAEGLRGSVKISVAASSKGGLWVPYGGGVSFFNGGTNMQWYDEASGLKNTYVMLGLEAKDGNLYLITGGQDVEVFSGGRITAVYPCKNWLTAIAEDAEGVVVAGGGELYRVGTNSLEPYVSADGANFSLGYVFNMVSGRDGSLWIATSSELVRVRNGTLKRWTLDNGVPDTKAFWICEDEEGVVWAGLTSGIARLKDGQLRYIRRKDGLFGELICGMVLDNSGEFWVLSDNGFFRIPRRSLNDFADGKTQWVESVGYNDLNQVKSFERNQQFPSGCKTLDGRIWFPTAQGVVMIDPQRIATNGMVPPVHIDRMQCNGAATALTQNMVLPPGKGELEFHFTGLSFIAPQKMIFRYRLEGYDKDWVDAGNRRMAFYTNLKPGPYKFQVIAANSDGVWNETGDSVAIELRPYFRQTVWFYALCGGLACAALGGVYAWRVRHLHSKQRALQAARDLLEQRVRERTVELAYERDLLRALLENSSDRIYFKDTKSRFVRCSKSKWSRSGASEAEIIGKTDFDLFQEKHARPAFEDEQEIIRTGKPILGKLETETHPDGRITWAMTTKMPWRDAEGKIIGTFGISTDVTSIKNTEEELRRNIAEMKRMQQEVEETHKQLVDVSRQAGQAEVASSVLHNVGNVLNSVNVSAGVVLDRIQASKALAGMTRIAELLAGHQHDLAQFLTSEGRAEKVPGYLKGIVEQLKAEQATVFAELQCLTDNINHIKEIVAMQQNFARISGVTEIQSIPALLDDALRMHAASLERHDARVVRQFEPVPDILVDKHKVLQILVNLITNAKWALSHNTDRERILTLGVSLNGDNRLRVSVTDNGIGITSENLKRIFTHGFTTRKDGHGFGLHGAVLSAREMGGDLVMHSDGPDKGATFTLELPCQSKDNTHGQSE